MKKVLKWIAIVLGGLVGLLILVVLGLAIYADAQFKPVHAGRPLHPITADTSLEGMARGQYLMENVTSCAEACHAGGEDGSLSGFIEEIAMGPIRGQFAVPNLTPDEETGLGAWTDAEIARAIREGVDKDGVELVIMPSAHYNVMSDADVAAVVGYLRNLEPVRHEVPPVNFNWAGEVAFTVLPMGGQPAIQEPINSVQEAPLSGTEEYGRYLVSLGACRECHGPELAGGPLPFAAPDDTPSANLTPAGELSGWTVEDFIAAVSQGQHPTGRELDEGMPRYQMTPEDLADIFAYLQTVPAVQPEG